MHSEPIFFTGSGGRKLAGRIERALGRRRGGALFVHCFTCGKASLAAVRISRALASLGFDVLRFDFAGIGESEGDFADSTFAANLDDIAGAAHALAERGGGPDLLVGHSLGGAAVLAAAGGIGCAKAVAVIGAPAGLTHLEKLLGDGLGVIEAEGVAEVDLGGASPVRIGRDLIESLRRRDLSVSIRGLNLPLMVLHAPGDAVVSVDNGLAIFEQAAHPKSFVALDGADHLLLAPDMAAYAAEVIAAWSGRVLPPPAAAAVEPGVARAALTGGGDFQVRIDTSSASFLADEPEDMGGLASGPTPYELLSAGLGACTAMTLNLYARRKGWSLDGLTVDVAHVQRPEGGGFDRRVHLPPRLDEDQRTRLMQIADKCPVHRSLEGGLEIQTTLGGPALPAAEPEDHARDMTAACEDADA